MSGRGEGRTGGGGQGGCEQRSEVFVKMQKKVGGGSGPGWGSRGRGSEPRGSEQTIEVFVKIKKKIGGGGQVGGWGGVGSGWM